MRDEPEHRTSLQQSFIITRNMHESKRGTMPHSQLGLTKGVRKGNW